MKAKSNYRHLLLLGIAICFVYLLPSALADDISNLYLWALAQYHFALKSYDKKPYIHTARKLRVI